MSFSVNTNRSALVALQTLGATNSSLDKVQNRINTGLKVSSAKDNGAIYAIAEQMRGQVAGLQAAQDSIDRGQSVIDVALAAGNTLSELLRRIKEIAVNAADENLSSHSRAALAVEFKELDKQIFDTVQSAEFNGINLLDGSFSSTTTMAVLANHDGSKVISISGYDLGLGMGVIRYNDDPPQPPGQTVTIYIPALEESIENLSVTLAKLGTASKRLELHGVFVSKLSDALNVGIGNLVDANLAKDSADLQALQVKQQLGVQALALANQRPQGILSLFG